MSTYKRLGSLVVASLSAPKVRTFYSAGRYPSSSQVECDHCTLRQSDSVFSSSSDALVVQCVHRVLASDEPRGMNERICCPSELLNSKREAGGLGIQSVDLGMKPLSFQLPSSFTLSLLLPFTWKYLDITQSFRLFSL